MIDFPYLAHCCVLAILCVCAVLGFCGLYVAALGCGAGRVAMRAIEGWERGRRV